MAPDVDVSLQIVRNAFLQQHPAEGRAERLGELARLSPAHPSLQWQVNGTLLAHRRADDVTTACGRSGTLEVAIGPLPPCPKCYQSDPERDFPRPRPKS